MRNNGTNTSLHLAINFLRLLVKGCASLDRLETCVPFACSGFGGRCNPLVLLALLALLSAHYLPFPALHKVRLSQTRLRLQLGALEDLVLRLLPHSNSLCFALGLGLR